MSVDGSTPRPRPQQPPATAPEPQPAPRRGPGRPTALCAAPWPGPGTARPWTRARPPSCWTRAATSSPSCSGMPRGPGTPGWSAPAAPGVITYSRKVFIPLTRLCRDRCHYCTFATVPGRLGRPSCRPTRSSRSPRRGAQLGCKEALFTLGDRPEDRWHAGQGVARRARLRLHPGLRPGHGDPGARGDRPAAAPEPGGDELAGLPAAEAGRAVDGHDAGDDRRSGCSTDRAARTSAARTRIPRSGCGCSRTPAAATSRSPPAS